MAPQNSDRAMGGMIRRGLSVETGTLGSCPAPDILAAYYDRSLAAEEVSRCELHLSQCSRCREQMALIAGSDEKPQSAGAKEWIWDWRWLAATAAVLILAISWGVKQSEHVVTSDRPSETPLLALSEPSQPPAAENVPGPPAPGTSSDAGAPSGDASALRKSENQETSDSLKQESSEASAEKKLEAPASALARASIPTPAQAPTSAAVQQNPTIPPVSNQRQSETVNNLPLNGRNYSNLQSANGATDSAPKEAATARAEAQAKTAVRASARDVGAVPESAPAAPSANDTTGAVQGSEANNEVKPAQPRAAAGVNSLKGAAVGGIRQGAAQGNGQNSEQRSDQILIRTPDPKVLWRIAGAGFVERTTDGGATWNGQRPDSNAQLVDGSAPSAKVCWLVGNDGAILVTKDAMKWRKLPPPIPADFTAVMAKSSSEAIVTTADGQKFSTTDGGKKWKPAQ